MENSSEAEKQAAPSGEAGEAAPSAEPRVETTSARSTYDVSGFSQDDARLRGRIEHFVPELLKRTLYAGLGAVFTTEEGIRRIASEFQLPKDVANFLIQQAGSSKDELFRIFAKELRAFLESLNVSGELQKLLTSLSFEVKTEIRFIPNEEKLGGVAPEIKRKVAVKRDKTG